MSGERIPAAVLGATGYVGGEFLRLIALHPRFELRAAVSESAAGAPIAATFPHLRAAYPETTFASPGNWLETLDRGGKLALFSAAPHGASSALVRSALSGAAERDLDVRVVDASADFRYASAKAWEAVYGAAHGAPELIGEFLCAVPEHARDASPRHVGHPGCFATAVLLALVPLVRAGLAGDSVFASGITGSTGSGKSPQPGTHHPERHGNLYAYKPLAHRHAPEIAALTEAASGRTPKISFVPHSGPFARGIYVTLHAEAGPLASRDAVRQAFDDAYEAAPFVEVLDEAPRLKTVVASNRCQLGFAVEDGAIVVFCAIDNLVKGAAGGAVQWMNRLFGLDETSGLTAPSPAWT